MREPRSSVFEARSRRLRSEARPRCRFAETPRVAFRPLAGRSRSNRAPSGSWRVAATRRRSIWPRRAGPFINDRGLSALMPVTGGVRGGRRGEARRRPKTTIRGDSRDSKAPSGGTCRRRAGCDTRYLNVRMSVTEAFPGGRVCPARHSPSAAAWPSAARAGDGAGGRAALGPRQRRRLSAECR